MAVGDSELNIAVFKTDEDSEDNVSSALCFLKSEIIKFSFSFLPWQILSDSENQFSLMIQESKDKKW